jgi:hypothetical protein
VLRWLIDELLAVRERRAWPVKHPRHGRRAVLDTGITAEALEEHKRGRATVAFFNAENYLAINRSNCLRALLDAAHSNQELHFDLASDPCTVKRVLQAIAATSPCGDEVGCGAGFISRKTVTSWMTEFSSRTFFELFGNTPQAKLSSGSLKALNEIDAKFGEFWTEDIVHWAVDRFFNRHELYVCKVWR